MPDLDRLPLEDFSHSAPRPPGRGDEAIGFQLAARASYLTPVLALAVGMLAGAFFGTRQSVRGAIVVGSINLVILGAGLVLAAVALLGIGRHGRSGILWPAVI